MHHLQTLVCRVCTQIPVTTLLSLKHSPSHRLFTLTLVADELYVNLLVKGGPAHLSGNVVSAAPLCALPPDSDTRIGLRAHVHPEPVGTNLACLLNVPNIL